VAQRGDDGAEAKVGGAEVVPPLANAVGLVDDEEGGGGLLETRQRLLVGELLRGEEEEFRPALLDVAERFLPRSRAEGRVDDGGVSDVLGGDRFGLVFLEGDQRRNDDGGAEEQRPGNLVDGRLAGAGRQDREGVVAVEDSGDGLLLARPQRLVPEFFARGAAHPLQAGSPGRHLSIAERR
jgi:hypothetical protein